MTHYSPFDLDAMSNEEAMRDKIISAARFARENMLVLFTDPQEYAAPETLAAMLETAIEPDRRADCAASHDCAVAYFAQYLPDHLARCAAFVLHSTGPQQRLMLGTLAAA